jgi:hypothetical protein
MVYVCYVVIRTRIIYVWSDSDERNHFQELLKGECMSFMERRIEARIEKALVEAARKLGGLAIKIAPVSFVG